MSWRVYSGVLILALASCCWAQGAHVTIENPKNLSVDEERIKALYTSVCKEVAENYHVGDYSKLEFPLTVVLGDERERYLIDHGTGAGTVYLQKWDDAHFASAATMLAFHHVLPDEQFRLLAMKALKRFWSTSPVAVSELKHQR